MDFKELLVSSWHRTIGSIGPLLLSTFTMVLVSVCSFGILAPVAMAGYTQSLLRMIKEDREPKVGDLFSEMRLFLPLFVFFLLSTIAVAIGFVMLVLPGIVVGIFLTFAGFYLLPLMTDKRLGLIDALKESWAMAMAQPVSDHIIVVILFLVLTSLGSSLPFAFLITQPIATFVLLGAYLKRDVDAADRSVSTPPPPPPAD